MTQRKWHKPGIAAWCAVIAMAILMGGLGVWQLQRLAQKEALMATIANAHAQPPSGSLPLSRALLKQNGFMKYRVIGELLHEHEMHLGARYRKSKLGYELLTPLQLDDGRILLVNRGWVPTDKKDPATRPETLVRGMQHYTVMLRTDRDHSIFTPNHDIADNIWFWRDIPLMKKETGLDLLPVSADIVMENPAADELPIPGDGAFALRNDHLGYAITWFLVGLSGIVIFFFYHYRPNSEKAA